MNAIVYVNTPLEAPEHAALAALARREGRAKGQQLRLLAIQAMRGRGNRNGNGSKSCGGGCAAVIGTAGSDSAPASGNGKRERAPSAASRGGDCGRAGGGLAPAGDALGAGAAAAVRESKRMSRSKSKNTTAVTGKGGRV